jgi:hypothetical protein
VTLKSLNVQIQPERSPRLDCDAVVAQLLSLASESQMSEGDDSGRYAAMARTVGMITFCFIILIRPSRLTSLQTDPL